VILEGVPGGSWSMLGVVLGIGVSNSPRSGSRVQRLSAHLVDLLRTWNCEGALKGEPLVSCVAARFARTDVEVSPPPLSRPRYGPPAFRTAMTAGIQPGAAMGGPRGTGTP
jgi:hypothetical protein